MKSSKREGQAKPQPTSPVLGMTVDEFRGASDREVGLHLLAIWIAHQAGARGVPVDEVTEKLAGAIVTATARADVIGAIRNDNTAPLAIAIWKAAQGNVDEAGRIIRQHLLRGAVTARSLQDVATAAPILKQKRKWAKDASEGRSKRGAETRKRVEEAVTKLMQKRKRPISQRALANAVAKEINIPVGTVRGHLRNKGKKVD